MLERHNLSRRAVLRGAAGVAAGAAVALPAMRTGGLAVLAQDATPSAGGESYPEVVYQAAEYKFDGPASIAGGLTRVTLQNAGAMDHHAMFVKFNEGKSAADLPAAFEQGLEGLASLGVSVGGPGSIAPGQESTVILDLAEGEYVILCIIPDDDGVAHAAKGMVLPVTVTAGTSAATPPEAGTIQLVEFGFSGLPPQVPTGTQGWKVENAGQQLHELVIYQLAPGVTFEQAQAIFSAPPATPEASMEGMEGMDMATPAPAGPPFVAVTGWAPASPGTSGWLEIDLAAGDYFAICFVPDTASGAPHFALGMIAPFTVA